MTTYELLEMVSLDALGLLDEHEREEFERAFLVAPAAVQAQIRREQSRLARTEALLPEIEPPPGLRARVVAAVKEAMQAVAGRRRAAGWLPAMLPSRGVTPIWRAAAIGCAAASIVFAVTTVYMRSQFAEVTDRMAANAQQEEIVKEFGARFRSILFSTDTEFVKFDPMPGARTANGQAGALLMLEGDRSSGQLLLKDLPQGPGEYSLCVVDGDGHVIGDAIVHFRAADTYQRVKGLKLKSGQSLAIVAPPAGRADHPETMLRSVRS